MSDSHQPPVGASRPTGPPPKPEVSLRSASVVREQLEHLGPWRSQVGIEALDVLLDRLTWVEMLVNISEQSQMILRRDAIIIDLARERDELAEALELARSGSYGNLGGTDG